MNCAKTNFPIWYHSNNGRIFSQSNWCSSGHTIINQICADHMYPISLPVIESCDIINQHIHTLTPTSSSYD